MIKQNTFSTTKGVIIQISDNYEGIDMAIKHKSDVSLPELLFTGKGDPAKDRKVIRLASEGLLLKLYQGVYTSNLASPAETV